MNNAEGRARHSVRAVDVGHLSKLGGLPVGGGAHGVTRPTRAGDRPPAEQRRNALQFLEEKPVDIRVIGGGIVGAGVARDAAMRGLRVGLVEQHDSAFGTSSRSSRLLHGGLRYLAQGRLGLVHEASVEKKIIHYIAPHLAEPLPFIFPTYRGNRHWVLWQLKIGVKIYDLLCSGRNLGKSTWLSVAEVLRAVPGVNATGLKGASTRWRKRGETPRCARTERQVPDSGRLGFVAAFGGTEFQQSSIRSNMFIGDPQDTFQAPSGATWLGHKARAR